MIFFKKKRVELGSGHIIGYTLFESKYLFSIIVYNWKTIDQNRFHSHAFAAVAFLLRGSYREKYYDKKTGEVKEKIVNQWLKPRYLPKNYTHCVLKSEPNTWTIVFVGPWQKHWCEFFPQGTNTTLGKWVKYGWGRKIVESIKDSDVPDELK